jgi:hypothetical protein
MVAWVGRPANHLFAWSKHDRFSFMHHQRQVQRRQRSRTMRYDNHNASFAPKRSNCVSQSGFSVGIVVRIGLIKDDQERISKKRPR